MFSVFVAVSIFNTRNTGPEIGQVGEIQRVPPKIDVRVGYEIRQSASRQLTSPLAKSSPLEAGRGILGYPEITPVFSVNFGPLKMGA